MSGKLQPGQIPSRSLFERTVGDAALEPSEDEIACPFEALFKKAPATG